MQHSPRREHHCNALIDHSWLFSQQTHTHKRCELCNVVRFCLRSRQWKWEVLSAQVKVRINLQSTEMALVCFVSISGDVCCQAEGEATDCAVRLQAHLSSSFLIACLASEQRLADWLTKADCQLLSTAIRQP